MNADNDLVENIETPLDHASIGLSGLERLFTLSPALLCIAGTDGYFKRINPAFQKTLGHTESTLLSRPFIDFVHPDDREATLNEVLKLSTGIPAVHFENRYRHANGSYRWLLWNTTPEAEEELLYATALDITGRKHASEMFRDLLRVAPDAILIVDLGGKILQINNATKSLFGYGSNKLIGQSIELLVPARFRGKHRKHISDYAKAPMVRSMTETLKTPGVRKDGSEFSAEISLGPAGDGQAPAVICIVRDSSLREQRERALVDESSSYSNTAP